jgi:hypothetical protein
MTGGAHKEASFGVSGGFHSRRLPSVMNGTSERDIPGEHTCLAQLGVREPVEPAFFPISETYAEL